MKGALEWKRNILQAYLCARMELYIDDLVLQLYPARGFIEEKKKKKTEEEEVIFHTPRDKKNGKLPHDINFFFYFKIVSQQD